MAQSSKNKVLSWTEIEKKVTTSYWIMQVFGNLIGICLCFSYFAFFYKVLPENEKWTTHLPTAAGMTVFLILLGRFLSKIWMTPLISFVRHKARQTPVSETLEKQAKNKILNLPAASAVISLFNWSFASVAVPLSIVGKPSGLQLSLLEKNSFAWVVMGIFISGAVTSVMIFFGTELGCRKIWVRFFPHGEFIQIKGVFRLKLWPRILIIFLMVSLLPLTDMAVVSYQKAQMMLTTDPALILHSLLVLIVFLLGVELSLVVVLSSFMSQSIVAPILDLKTAMRRVENADFSARARVMDNNELGELSLHFNQMTQGLKERYDMMQSLAIAEEVQQNLLPESVPVVQGLDIAGRSLYCDQTGGDYYDFINSRIEGRSVLVAALGDVSGHGIPSALLMASARAFLRQRLALSGSLDQIVNDVNVQFCRDVGDSGRFMTLFLIAWDVEGHTCEWIRAGHDPALLYDPHTDEFTQLKQGAGIPLGIDETYTYRKNTINKDEFQSGQVLFIGTDGIWESKNKEGVMFGKQQVKQVIRAHKNETAQAILDKLLKALDRFMGSSAYDDDVTLIIAKKNKK